MHIGLIMDGNGRWATQRSLPRTAGHIEGLKACKKVVSAACELGIDYLTLYVFSTENWKRPVQEVSYLMDILKKKLPEEVPFYADKNIRIRFCGNLYGLSDTCRAAVEHAVETTSKNTGLTVTLAINYGGQDEITRAVNRFVKANPGEEITKEKLEKYLDNPDIPAPDMIVRSAGERRLSNFLLWESAYSELFSIDTLWPDWGKEQLVKCLEEYSKRNRKFGGIQQ